MNIVRKLYDWVLGWSESRWGTGALGVLSFVESSFFPVPPDVLLIALCLGRPRKAFFYAFICSLFSVLGALGGYAIGYFLWQTAAGEPTALANWFFDSGVFTREGFDSVKSLFERWDFWVIFTAGFTPIPFKLFTIAGGLFGIGLWGFVLAAIVSRGLRFFIIAGLIWKFGAPVKVFIDKYFNWLALGFTVLLVGGFVLIRYLL